MMHAAVQIIRVGRKRKSGRRHPNGELANARGENVGLIAMRHPERQGLPVEMRIDQAAGTPLGRFKLLGLISDDMLEASKRYARDVRQYLMVFGAPSPNAPSLDLSAGSRGMPIPLDEGEIGQRLSNYNAAFEAVYDAGHRAARAVARMAVYDERLPEGATLADLTRGLSALAHHYGLTGTRKSRNSRNRD
jgi:hypothetical protein